MKKLFNLEMKRLYRSKVFLLMILLMVLIGGLGIVLNQVFYKDMADERMILLSLYNSYTQFTYLILGFVFVSIFAKDYQNGVYAWMNQMNYGMGQVLLAKVATACVVIIPLIDIVFIVTQVICGIQDKEYLGLCILHVDFNVLYIVLLALLLSIIMKRAIQATLTMYGLLVIFNGANLIGYGMVNPSDSNSLCSYYLSKVLIDSQSHYSLSKLTLSDGVMRFVSIGLPLVWSLILGILIVFMLRVRKKG